jgi:hypothetical protein
MYNGTFNGTSNEMFGMRSDDNGSFNSNVFVVKDGTGELLGQLSVFISAILLSCGGCLSMLLAHMRRSNCSRISCLGSKCTRQNLEIDDPV